MRQRIGIAGNIATKTNCRQQNMWMNFACVGIVKSTYDGNMIGQKMRWTLSNETLDFNEYDEMNI